MSGILSSLTNALEGVHQNQGISDQVQQYQQGSAPQASLTHEVLGAGVSYEIMKAINDRAAANGQPPAHAELKQMIAGLAGGLIEREVETRGIPFGASSFTGQTLLLTSSEEEKKLFCKKAADKATADCNQAVRQSGIYSDDQLEPYSDEENQANYGGY